MKILFTGCTAKQTDDEAWKRARVKRIDDSSIICNSLRKQGYIVDRKTVEWGEDLSKYDLAIVGMGAFGSNNYSGNIMNALYALHFSKKAFVFYEDWKIDGNMSSYKGMLKQNEFEKAISKKWSNGNYFYGGVDNINFKPEIAKEIIKKLTIGFYDAIIPAFDWGNKQIVRDVIKSKNIYNLDLTPYVIENWNINLKPEPKEKQKKFMLASLVDHRPWVKKQMFSWNTDYFGAKSIKEAQLLESETEVFEKCGEYWGILCPEYPNAGSGWFRIRYIYAALHKNIIITSPKDYKALGVQWKRIEYMSDEELEDYAKELRKAIFTYSWNKETFDKRLKEIVDGTYKK